MAEARWDQVALLAALLAEPYRNDEEHPAPYTAADFHPLVRKKPAAAHPANWIPYNEDIIEAIATGKWKG
jgi:hypothetical protein